MHKAKTWRELLGHIIEDTRERQRIADKLGIRPITLVRWVKSDSMRPRPHNLQSLLNALPGEYREAFRELIPEEMTPIVKDDAPDTLIQGISPVFYARVLHALATVPQSLRSQTIYDLILQQAQEQLDPHRFGLAIIIVRCMPPWRDGKIHSLRETIGLGTPPWGRNLEARAVFLGSESLAGYALIVGRYLVVQNLDEKTIMYPIHRDEYEKSTAIYPILRGGLVTGCLLVSSTQYDYFPPSRLDLIQRYADLIALAFEPAEYYPLECLELRPMPPSDVQRTYFSTYRQRVIETMTQASRFKTSMNLAQAEQVVWQEIEAELLQLPLD
jgi:GAF domain